MFLTNTSDVVLGLTHIPNLFLHQEIYRIYSLAQQFSPTITDNRNTTVERIFRVHCYSSTKISMFFALGWF